MGTQLQTQCRQPLPPAPEATWLREGFIRPLDCGDSRAGCLRRRRPGWCSCGVWARRGCIPGWAPLLGGRGCPLAWKALLPAQSTPAPPSGPALSCLPRALLWPPACLASPVGFPCLRYLLAFLFRQTVIYFLNWSKGLKTEP